MKLFLTGLLITAGAVLFAKQERYSARMNGVDYNTSPTALVLEDDKFYEVLASSNNFVVQDVSCFAKLGIEEGITNTFQSQFDINVTFNVKGYTSPYSFDNLGTVTLHCEYYPGANAPNIALASKKLVGYHKVEISVQSIVDNVTGLPITSMPVNSYIELEMVVNRFYGLDEDAVFDPDFELNHEILSGTAEISFFWNYIRGAEYYELEWTHVNSYSTSGTANPDNVVKFTESEFKYNSTRIRTSSEHYEIPLIFEKGFVVYRLRPVGVGDNDDADGDLNNEIFGKWTTWIVNSGTPADTRSKVNQFPHYVQITDEHEALINWQYQAVYAEEGKKKDIVSYYDGALRNRQTATRISSNDKVVIGETIYDSEGRPAVTILPSPTVTGPIAAADVLGYHPAFNQNANDLAYSLYDFDLSTNASACGVFLPGTLNNETGAGMYYGENITATGNWQDLVPDANGFPFVQVEYMPDNSGRIKRQSGVGEDYTIDGDHATRYFYTQPLQEELDRLFGTNAGYKSRYKKNIVIDANGQASVSYIDPFGRVIATALVGAQPENLNPLVNKQGATLSNPGNTIVGDLLAKTNDADPDTPDDQNHRYATGNFGAIQDGLKFYTQQVVYQNNSTLSYKYTLEADRFEINCGTNTFDYPYVFDLKIGLEDECGNNVYTVPVNQQIGTISDPGGQSYINDAITGSGTIEAVSLPVGNYASYKLLTVNEDAAYALADQYILGGQTAGCIKTLADFQNTFVSDIDFTGCGYTCETCLESLGANDDAYIADRELDYDWDNLTLIEQQVLTDQFENEYLVLVEECEALCGTGISYCETVREQMLGDVSPFGQYGAISGDMTLSVFNPNHELPGASGIDWTNPASPYTNADGTMAYVDVVFNGVSWNPEISSGTVPFYQPGTSTLVVLPQDLANLSDFLDIWDQGWAESLLPAHPESCYLNGWCSDSEFEWTESINGNIYSTEDIDNLLMSINTFDAAYSVAELGNVNITDLSTLIGLDPFFDNSNNTFAGVAETQMLNFYTFTGTPTTTLDLWEFAVFAVNEGDNWGIEPSPLPGNTTVDATNEDEIWNTFKMLYISVKQAYYQQWAHTFAIEEGCYNGCIGNDGFDFYQYGFATANSSSGLGGINPGNILNDQLPCSMQNADLFPDKTARFFGVNDILVELFGNTPDEMVDNTNLNIYNETGMCPLAFDLMNFLNGLAGADDLVQSTSQLLNGKPYFGIQFYAALGGTINSDFSFTGQADDMFYTTTTAGTNNEILEIAIENSTSTNACQSIALDINQYGSIAPGNLSWLDYGTDWTISSFHSFHYINQAPTGVYNFEIIAVIHDLISMQVYEVTMQGTTCIMIGQCVVDGQTGSPAEGTIGALQIPCNPYDEATGLLQLFNAMLYDTASTKYFFHDTYIPASDVNYLVSGNSFLNWQVPGNYDWDISTGLSPCVITLTETNTDLQYIFTIDNVPANVQSFVEIIPFTAPNVKFKMVLEDGSIVYSDATLQFVPQGWDPQNLVISDCGDCVGDEQLLTAALDQFVVNLIEDGSDAVIPDLIIEYLGLDAYAATISVVGPVVSGTNLLFGFDITGDQVDDNVGTFMIYPTDGTTDLQSLSISGYTPLYSLASSGPGFGEKEIITNTNQYVQINIQSPVPVVDCPCNDQAALPLTCADAYTLYLSELPGGVNAVASQQDFCALNYQLYLTPFLQLVNNAVDAGYPASSINLHNGTVFVGQSTIDPFSVYVYIMENNFTGAMTYDEYLDAISGTGISPISQAEFDMVLTNSNCTRWYNSYLGATQSPTLNIDDFCGTYNTGCQPAPVIDFDIWDDYSWTYENDCEEQLIATANLNAIEAYNTYIESVTQEFITNYINSALENVVETFELEAPDNEYHYTLYYYDQAGNLIRTVPPGGVNRVDNPTGLDDIKLHRASATTSTFDPDHRMMTTYGYNALNQLVIQNTPDGGTSRFWYDALGRLVVSQNEQQNLNSKFSYTVYDELGRIVEVGELLAESYMLDANHLPLDADTYFNDLAFPGNFSAGSAANEQRFEITRTYYDEPLLSLGGDVLNGRNRIGSVTYNEKFTTDPLIYNSAYHYQYDIHGNVRNMVQEMRRVPEVEKSGITSTVDYTYDLVSGNVLEVAYNKGQVDQFFHRYEYDADNRITRTMTSDDGIHFESDAKYFYYDHGPLARTETGHEKVQGSDFAYTVQGWLKSVNGTKLDPQQIDMGHDAYQNTANLNSNIGSDAFGYALTYYTGDYEARTTGADAFLGDLSAIVPITQLYNGNIGQMATALMNHDETNKKLMANNYEYDQLNRIRHAQTYLSSGTTNTYTGSTTGNYDETFKFDHNGNITYLTRTNSSGALIDNFEYYYYDHSLAEHSGANVVGSLFDLDVDMTNKLAYVNDPAGTLGDDLNDQATGNYEYNLIGQLTRDEAEQIESIEWTVTGKVKKITRTTGSTMADLEFLYDPMGNRIAKIEKPRTGGVPSNEMEWTITYYTYDAGGNPMATYTKQYVADGALVHEAYTLDEQFIYGSSRVGTLFRNIDLGERTTTPLTNSSTSTWYNIDGSFYNIAQNSGIDAELMYDPAPDDINYEMLVGDKRYELSNHLGNVLEVVSDQKSCIHVGGVIDHYLPDVKQWTHYYAYGMVMESGGDNDYRYSFNGKEKIDEVSGSGNSIDFGARIYDARVGRWLSRDELAILSPGLTPYRAMKNNPLIYNDPNGRYEVIRITVVDYNTGNIYTIEKLNDNNKVMTDGTIVSGPVRGSACTYYQNYYNYMSNYTVYLNTDGTMEYSYDGSAVLTDSRGEIQTTVTIGTNMAKDGGLTQAEDNGHIIDFNQDEGSTFNGGWTLVTKEGGADHTKDKARNTVEVIEVGGLLSLVGGLPGQKNSGMMEEVVFGISDALDKLGDAMEEARGNSGEGNTNNSGGSGAASAGSGGSAAPDSIDVKVYKEDGSFTRYRVHSDSSDYPTKGNSRVITP